MVTTVAKVMVIMVAMAEIVMVTMMALLRAGGGRRGNVVWMQWCWPGGGAVCQSMWEAQGGGGFWLHP